MPIATQPVQQSPLVYRREIDGLRAIAVIPVILFHAGVETFGGGFVGVDVFFVISGYLITSNILLQLQQGRFSLLSFYERRARRILPALFFMMLCCVPLAWLYLTPNDLRSFAHSLIAVPVFVSNLLFANTTGYFDAAAELKPLLHTWSLGVEEQYYVLFPLLMLVLWRLGASAVILVLAIIGTLSFISANWGPQHRGAATFFLLLPRAWELLIGAAVALSFAHPESYIKPSLATSRINNLASLVGLALISYAIFRFDRNTPFPGYHALVPTIGTLLVIIFAGPTSFVGKLLGSKLLVGIGLISYSAYLWHQPMFAFAKHYSFAPLGQAVFLVLALASLAIAYLSWRFVERPFRNKAQINSRMLWALALIGSCSFIAMGYAGHVSNGFAEQRVSEEARAMLSTTSQSPKRGECHVNNADGWSPENACEYYGPKVDVAVIGDSHVVELAYALALKLEPDERGLKHFSYSACPPTFGRDSAAHSCADWTSASVAYILSNPSIKHVVISYRIHRHLLGPAESEQDLHMLPIEPLEREARWDSYLALTEVLRKAGKNVVLVLQAPVLSTHIDSLILRSSPNEEFVFGSTRRNWERRRKYTVTQLEDFHRDVHIVDPSEIFCDAQICFSATNGTALYFDGHHMSVHGAALVAEIIAPLVAGSSSVPSASQ